jgi:hypothetical protein
MRPRPHARMSVLPRTSCSAGRVLVPAMVMAMALLIGATAGAQPMAVAMRPRNQTAGAAVQIEAGRYDGGFGVAALYYQPLVVRGLILAGEAGGGFTGTDRQAPAARLHLSLIYGWMHRVLAQAGWTVVDRDTLRLHGSPALDETTWGPELAVGYELMTAAGPMVRGWVGARYLRRPSGTDADGWRPALGLAAGWKLW